MARGGIPSFIAGLEGSAAVEMLSDRFEIAPRTALKGLVAALCLAIVALIGAGISQSEGLTQETLELESTSSLAKPSTEFDEQSTASADAAQAPSEPALPHTLVVYVSGAVASPGLYTLSGNDRVGDAVDAAGGLLPDAAAAAVNLAEHLTDGRQIHIPRIDEVISNAPAASSATAQGTSTQEGATTNSNGAAALVDINTADSALLQTLDGVGPATAQKIIEYRSANGAFKSKEDIKNVTGIGEKKYAALEAQITV